ncbi:MAG: hypothetical protein LWX56_01070, partial [Ignavibacteria bacterium]|nr:hypothetical protein [Ignavibacteria bacterium]
VHGILPYHRHGRLFSLRCFIRQVVLLIGDQFPLVFLLQQTRHVFYIYKNKVIKKTEKQY